MEKNSLVLALLYLKGWGAKKAYHFIVRNNFDFDMCIDRLEFEFDEYERSLFDQEYKKANSIIAYNKKKGIEAISILDDRFPKKLYKGTEPCVFLYYVGDISLLSKKAITIIGTRNPSSIFIEKGKKIAEYFAKKDYVIVSGLAIGCDTIAHESCLNVCGKTIAVLPSSCDNPQPYSNKPLAEKIVKKGGLLISEYSSGTVVSKFNYPQRDRIQSLLSSVILVVQSSDDGGTMIAVRKSIKDGKKVFALDGNDLTLIKDYVKVDCEDELAMVEQFIK